MKQKFSTFWRSLFPPVGRRAALKIAAEACKSGTLEVLSGLSPNMHLYIEPEEPFWCVHVPWNDGKDGMMLRDSRIILVSFPIQFNVGILYPSPA